MNLINGFSIVNTANNIVKRDASIEVEFILKGREITGHYKQNGYTICSREGFKIGSLLGCTSKA
jgi:hypothetical protein